MIHIFQDHTVIEPEANQNDEIVSKSDGEEVLGSDESDNFHLSIALDGKFSYVPIIITSIYTFITIHLDMPAQSTQK